MPISRVSDPPGSAITPTPTVSRLGIHSDPYVIQTVDPSRCRLWPLHPRDPDRVNRRSCRTLINSIAAHGQFVPALGRPVRNDPELSVEILCGSRRLFAARQLEIPLLVQVRDLSNWECALVVEIENRVRRTFTRLERDSYFKAIMDQALAQPRAGELRPKDYDALVRTRTRKPLFTVRSYYNVVEFVFPTPVDELTVELMKDVVADAVDPQQLIAGSVGSTN